MVIDKINKPPIGEITITFSKRNHLFCIEYPPTVSKSDAGQIFFATYDDALKQINEVHCNLLSETYLIKKVILIHLETSVSQNTEIQHGEFQGRPFVRTNYNHLDDAQGFRLQWYVAEVYQYPKTIKYKVIEAHKNSRNFPSKRVDILPQLITSSGDLREIDYREDLHQFLVNLDDQIIDMVKKLDAFFDIDPKKLVENFERNQLPKLMEHNSK